MAENRIIIETRKKSGKEEDIPRPLVPSDGEAAAVEASGAVQMEPDENVWGSDYELLSKLDEKQRADRRFYARVRHVQQVVCDNSGQASDPDGGRFSLTISDLSMGGIGVICDEQLKMGSMVTFKMLLDNIAYQIECQVSYCVRNKDKYRALLMPLKKDKVFIKHLKIYVARMALQNMLN